MKSLSDVDDPLESEPDSPKSQAPAVLIVTVRRGGLLDKLIPPALIALIAGLVLLYRGAQSEWDGLSLPSFLGARAVAAPALNSPATPEVLEAEVVEAKVAEITPPPSGKFEARPAETPVEPAKEQVATLVDPPTETAPTPEIKADANLAEAAKAKVWDDIAQEAEKARTQQAELERIKAFEDAKAAAAPPPADPFEQRLQQAMAEFDAAFGAQRQIHQQMQREMFGDPAARVQRRREQAEALRRNWINGIPDQRERRAGVPAPPRPLGNPRHEAFADLAEPNPGEVQTEVQEIRGPGNVRGIIIRRQFRGLGNEVPAPPAPRPFGDEGE